MGGWFSRLFGGGSDPAPNPVMEEIEKQYAAPKVEEPSQAEQREAKAKKARDEAAAEKATYDAARKVAAAEAAEDLRRARADAQAARNAEARAQAAREADRKAAEAVAAEAARRVQEAAKAAKDAEAKAAAAAEAAREKAEKDEKEMTQLRTDLNEAENRWKRGIRPVELPTREEFEAAKERFQYNPRLFHIAVAGISGTGKSTLINAFRALRPKDRDAAKTGVTETTLSVDRFTDPKYPNLVWYDVPGAGTLSVPDWKYFNEQGLFVFDSILIVHDNRFTATDIAILRSCHNYNIPCFIVRTKSDNNIENLARNYEGFDEEDEEYTPELHDSILSQCRTEYAAATRASVTKNLATAGLPAQRVYIVSSDALRGTVTGRMTNKSRKYVLDEADLLRDLVQANCERRLSHDKSYLKVREHFQASVSAVGRAVASLVSY